MSDLIYLEKPTPSAQDVQAPQPAPINYANTFDPSHPQYAVNTGNANVRQLEDLNSMFSTAPQAQKKESVSPYMILVLAFGLFLIFKGRK